MNIFILIALILINSACTNLQVNYSPLKKNESPKPAKLSRAPENLNPSLASDKAAPGECKNFTKSAEASNCYLNLLNQKTPILPLQELLPIYSEACSLSFANKNELFMKLSYCFGKAGILGAFGKSVEAKSLRRETCSLDYEVCAKFLSMTTTPNFFDIVDVADEMCSRSLIKSGYVKNLYLDGLCSIHKNSPSHSDLETEYIKSLAANSKKFEEFILKVRNDNQKLPLTFDFTKYDQERLVSFHRSLETMTFPIRVKFNLSNTGTAAMVMEVLPEKLMTTATGFDDGKGENWQNQFSGYISLPQTELYKLAKQFPFHKSQVVIPAGGIIIGYHQTGVVPVPIIVLDPIPPNY